MNKQPKSFKSLMVTALVRPFIIVGALAFGFFVMSHFGPVGIEHAKPVPPAAAEPTKAERLMVKHDCWNGEAPADMVGVIPGHVIITEAGRTYRAGSVKVGTALEVIFNDAESEIEEIHGFCR